MTTVKIESVPSVLRNVRQLRLVKAHIPYSIPMDICNLVLYINGDRHSLSIPIYNKLDFKSILRTFSKSGFLPHETIDIKGDFITLNGNNVLSDQNLALERPDVVTALPTRIVSCEFDYNAVDNFYSVSDTTTGAIISKASDTERYVTKTSYADHESVLNNHATVFTAADYSLVNADLETAEAIILESGNTVAAANGRIYNALDTQVQSVVWSPSLSQFIIYKSNSSTHFRSDDGIEFTGPLSNTIIPAALVWASSLNLFVATKSIGSKVGIYTSPDGITFTLQYTSLVDAQPKDVRWFSAASLFFVFCNNAVYFTSSDGLNWNVLDNTSGPTPIILDDIAYGLGKYVGAGAVAGVNAIATSSDGLSWSQIDMGQLDAHRGYTKVVFSSNTSRFVIGSTHQNVSGSEMDSAKRIAISSDGITWTYPSLPTVDIGYNRVRHLEYFNELGLLFCILYNDGSTSVKYVVSTDALTWTYGGSQTTGQTLYETRKVAFSPELGRVILTKDYELQGSGSTTGALVLFDFGSMIDYIKSKVNTAHNAVPWSSEELYKARSRISTHAFSYELDDSGRAFPAMILSEAMDQYDYIFSYIAFEGVTGFSFQLRPITWLTVDDVENVSGKPIFPFAFHATDFGEPIESQTDLLNRCILEFKTPTAFLSANVNLRRAQIKFLLKNVLIRTTSKLGDTTVYNMYQIEEIYNIHDSLDSRIRTENTAIPLTSLLIPIKLHRNYKPDTDGSFSVTTPVTLIPRYTMQVDNIDGPVYFNPDRVLTKLTPIRLFFEYTVKNNEARSKTLTGNAVFASDSA